MWKRLYEKLLAYFGSMYFESDGTCWPLRKDDREEESV